MEKEDSSKDESEENSSFEDPDSSLSVMANSECSTRTHKGSEDNSSTDSSPQTGNYRKSFANLYRLDNIQK